MTRTKQQADSIERIVSDLPALIRARRGSMSLRAAAKESGVYFTTLSRLERGLENPRATTLVQVLRWLGE
jgi:transcriptional regulator with XRE-family HTH domain